MAQLVARLVWDQKVAGAGPATPTVIIVVEGPSGAGKTTWCRTHGGPNALLEWTPDGSVAADDARAAAQFWIDLNVRRWSAAIDRERNDGLVVVDTDPFKLHYTWSLFQTGQATQGEWELAREATRKAFTAERLGLADIAIVSDVDERTLRARREMDTTRTRRNFARNVKLRDTTLRWYRAIDSLEPGRVMFGLPDGGVPLEMLALGPRRERSGAELFVRLMEALPPD